MTTDDEELFDEEKAYDEKVFPLMKRIIEICNAPLSPPSAPSPGLLP